MSEYVMNIGRRAELKQQLTSLTIAAGSHLESLRLALDPLTYAGCLDKDKILSLAVSLVDRINEVQEVEAQIRAINNLIGR